MKKRLFEKLKALRLYFLRQRLYNVLYEVEWEILKPISHDYRKELIEEWNEIRDRLDNKKWLYTNHRWREITY
jgi:restriction endonuclease S subunit